MLYKSTRGGEWGKSFESVLISSYASDGGLYVPEYLPLIDLKTLSDWATLPFRDVCAAVVRLFTDLDIELLRDMTKRGFAAFNDGNEPTLPMTKFDDIILLDASLGPTLAFKDIGQQVMLSHPRYFAENLLNIVVFITNSQMVAQLLNYYLGERNQKAKILVDTSGDTGPAAIAGVRGCPAVEIFVLYPYLRVSPVQELQMITVQDANVHVYRTEGTSDEQASVLRDIFNEKEFCQKHNLCSINSINWARIAVQSSYYIWAYLQVYNTAFSIGRPVHFCIPTGAFGNAIAGFVAKKMGVPIGRIFCATNANDIVYRTITSGDMSMGANVQTESPAMDIQFAYNVERMLYYMCNENPIALKGIMDQVDRQFSYLPGATGAHLDPLLVRRIQETFSAVSVSDADTLSTMRDFKLKYHFSLCPHSAIAVHAALTTFKEAARADPMVCVLTAHPAKFEEAVRKATGGDPTFPESVKLLKTLPHRFTWLRKHVTITQQHHSGEDESNSLSKVPIPILPQRSWRDEWIDFIKREIESV